MKKMAITDLPTRVKTKNLFQVDIDNLEQGCALLTRIFKGRRKRTGPHKKCGAVPGCTLRTRCQQCCYTELFSCNNTVTTLLTTCS